MADLTVGSEQSVFAEKKECFYKSVLEFLIKNEFKFMVGGGLSVREHAPDIGRPMKDLDIFVKGGDYPKILTALKKEGFKVSIPDARWLAKVKQNGDSIDIIFSSPNYISPVDDSWFTNAIDANLFGLNLKIISPVELIWCKAYVQERTWFDGADINHIILNKGKELNWKMLLRRMESHWELLLSVLLNFRFVYPADRGNVPKWLMNELISRLQNQMSNPLPQEKICRGPLISRTQYKVDIEQNDYQVIS